MIDFIVVIRSSNERTEKLCLDLVKKQAGTHEVIVLHEKPFKRALEEGYRRAIEKKTKWLITVDADMLILPGAIKTLCSQAEEMPEHYIQLQGRIFDKISGDVRKAGPRIYRVSLLEKALRFSKKSEDTIRPESFVISAMSDAGHPSRYISYVTCIHDFEQYYADLYRKSIVHANKHKEILSRIILRAVENMKSDKDFKVILKAVWNGLMSSQSVSIDTRLFKDEAESALEDLRLNEKKELDESFDFNVVLSNKIPKKIIIPSSDITFHDQPKQEYSPFKKVMNIYQKKGFVKGVLYSVGSAFVAFGNRIKQ